MENKLMKLTDCIPDLVKNTHLSFDLQGWPAAITAIAFFGAYVTIYAIKMTLTESNAGMTDKNVEARGT